MIFSPDREVDLHDIARYLGKSQRDLTIEDFKKIIPESRWDNNIEAPFSLVHIRNPYETSKWWQRLNRIWVIPVYILIVGPFSYIVLGKWHISEYSKLGKAIRWLIGE